MLFGWTERSPARHIRAVSFLFALIAAWFGGAPGWAATVQQVKVEHDRVVIRFDDRVARASAFLLGGPDRIALDIDGASPGGRSDTGGAVAAVRQGTRGAGGARIVFDLTRPAIVTEGRFGGDGRTLTLMLRTVDDARFARAAAEGRINFLPPFNYASAPPRREYSVSVNVPPAARPFQMPRIYGDDPTRPLVVIDAGHGGHDPGAIGPGGLREKDVTLQIAMAIRDELVRSGRVRVALTRETDQYLVLADRYTIGRRMGAALFISVHCDAAESGAPSGATAYTLSEIASDKEAARLAARENRADIIAGVDLGQQAPDISSILIDLTQRETMNVSASFARLLGREAQPLIPVKANFHRMASLVVLKAPDMPSILFETGYISNPADAARLASREGRARVAESVRRAVDIHFATRLAAR